MHDFAAPIPRCSKDIAVSSLFPCAERLSNSFSVECFLLAYNLNEFKSRIIFLSLEHLSSLGYFNIAFLYTFYLFILVFLVATRFLVAVHSCMGWILIEKKKQKQTLNTSSSFQKEQFAAFKGSEQRQEKTYFQVVEKIEEEDLQKQQDSFLQLAQLFSQWKAHWNIVLNFPDSR